MKLYYSPFSPFARKVRLSAYELGLDSQIELTQVDVYEDKTYTKINPLSKIPALVTKDSGLLTNSPYICEYLNSLSTGRKILPTGGSDRWQVLNIQSLCDGIMEASVLRRYEMLRPADRFYRDFDQRQKLKVTDTLAFLETQHFLFDQDWDLREISLLSAIGYLEFRFGHEKHLESCPNLARWYTKAMEKQMAQVTKPGPT